MIQSIRILSALFYKVKLASVDFISMSRLLSDLDSDEYTNYRCILSLMLFDRWQHCRQTGDRAKMMLNTQSFIENHDETFIHDLYTLISNINFLASIIQQHSAIIVSESLNKYSTEPFNLLLVIKFTVC